MSEGLMRADKESSKGSTPPPLPPVNSHSETFIQCAVGLSHIMPWWLTWKDCQSRLFEDQQIYNRTEPTCSTNKSAAVIML